MPPNRIRSDLRRPEIQKFHWGVPPPPPPPPPPPQTPPSQRASREFLCLVRRTTCFTAAIHSLNSTNLLPMPLGDHVHDQCITYRMYIMYNDDYGSALTLYISTIVSLDFGITNAGESIGGWASGLCKVSATGDPGWFCVWSLHLPCN